jgi:hypothetical protein
VILNIAPEILLPKNKPLYQKRGNVKSNPLSRGIILLQVEA